MWFGIRHTGAAYAECPQTETPVGRECDYCEEVVAAGEDGFILDSGTILHRECFMRGFTGSVAHQEKRCSCFGGTDDDEVDGMTRREGARAAMAYFVSHR